MRPMIRVPIPPLVGGVGLFCRPIKKLTAQTQPALLAAPTLCRANLPKIAARRWLLGQNATTEMVAALRMAVSSVRSNVLAARIKAPLTCDVRTELGRAFVPVLYIQAAQDRLLSDSCLAALRHIKTGYVRVCCCRASPAATTKANEVRQLSTYDATERA